MDTTGKLVSVARDIVSGKLTVSFTIDTEPVDDLNNLALLDKIDIKAEKHKKKRSLNANALLWLCIGKLAAALNEDKWFLYKQMLKRHGKYTYICVKPSVVEAVKAQWRECEEIGEIDINGKTAVQMLCYFGSSTFDTKEFSSFLEDVISEMRTAGLETPTSKETRRALELWEKQKNGKTL